MSLSRYLFMATVIREALAQALQDTLVELIGCGLIPNGVYATPSIEEPKNPEHGDYATNAAMLWAKAAGTNPRELGAQVAEQLCAHPAIKSADVAGPGFVNLRLDAAWVSQFVEAAIDLAEDPCPTKVQMPLRINVEFVSVNPNGPITIGSGRGAAYGSTLCNVLEAAGHEVHREYYINDGVNSEQMRLFGESVLWYAKQAVGHSVSAKTEPREFPTGGYKGDYVKEVAEVIVSKNPELAEEPSLDSFSEAAKRLMIELQKDHLVRFGVQFDTWFSEQSLHDSGRVQSAIRNLEEQGVADREAYRTKLILAKGGKVEEILRERQEGDPEDDDEPSETGTATGATLWLRSTLFGDDMDRVLQRRDGRLTYIASDVAYHEDKFNRPANADKLITVLGPDHHGYIGRLRAVVAASLLAHGSIPSPASGDDGLEDWEQELFGSAKRRDECRAALEEARRRLEVLIYQLVRFMKDGKPAPMRKRDGNIYALIDLMREIGQKVMPEANPLDQLESGKDVTRFFYLMRHHDTTFDFDLDLAEKQSDDNPVFYVQYAHARICSVLEKAEEAGIAAREASPVLEHPREIALIKKICDLPYEVLRCAEDYGVHRLTTYAIELARCFHHFYDACRVIQPDDPGLSSARIKLCLAARSALRGALRLLGVSAPTRMIRAE